jgi:hypothetical protein
MRHNRFLFTANCEHTTNENEIVISRVSSERKQQYVQFVFTKWPQCPRVKTYHSNNILSAKRQCLQLRRDVVGSQ